MRRSRGALPGRVTTLVAFTKTGKLPRSFADEIVVTEARSQKIRGAPITAMSAMTAPIGNIALHPRST
jgi:hypothetical protein